MAFHFPTLLMALATQTLLLSVVILCALPGIRSKWAVAAFSAASGFYVWFQLLSPTLSPLLRQQLGPILANETLPGALLIVFVYSALFYDAERRIRWVLLLPFAELVVRLTASLLLFKKSVLPSAALVLLGQVSIFVFSAFALWLLARHRKAYLMQTADNRLSMIYLYVSPALAIFLINLAWIIVQCFGGEGRPVLFQILFVFVLSLTIVWQLSVLILGKLSFYQVVRARVHPVSQTDPAPGANDPPDADAETKVSVLDLPRIIERIREQELYLDPSLTLIGLARNLGTNRASLSHLINNTGQINFNRFINGFRVDRAKRLLETSDKQILRVAFECGFNSKATFNRVFRQMVGQTPSRYRVSAAKSRKGESSEELESLEVSS